MQWILLAITVASFIYTWYEMNHLPQQTAQIQQVKGPTATEGIPIPVLFGTRIITSPNVVWYGNQLSVHDSNGAVKYWLGVHLALCHGRLDSFNNVYIGESLSGYIREPVTADVSGGVWAVDPTQYDGAGAIPTGSQIAAWLNPQMGMPNPTDSVDAGTDANTSGIAAFINKAMGVIPGPKYYGVAMLGCSQGYVGTSPVLPNWACEAQRIHYRNGGSSVQWYNAKAEIRLGYSREDKWKYMLTAASTDYSATSFDDSSWPEGRGGIGNAPAEYPAWKNMAASPDAYPVPAVKTQLTHADWPTLVQSSSSVTKGCYLWLRKDIGQLPKQDLGVQCWHDDSGELWFNGTAVTLKPTVDVGNPNLEHFNSTATIPAALVNPAGPNVVAFRVRDFYNSAGNPIGTSRYIYAGIQVGLDLYEPRKTVDMNPIHIIREVLTDSIWGAGYSDGDIGSSFTTAADTCYAENLGLSLLWDEQQTCMDFIAEILRYISGTLYINPINGHFEIKLIRADYTVGDLPVFDGTNTSTVQDIERQSVGQLVNSVTATYSCNPRGKQGAVTVFDSGLVTAQGGIVNQKVDYPAVSTSYIAGRLALRDLRVLSAPLLSCSVGTGRQAEALRPGDAFVLNRPDLGIDNMVMRVSEIDLGDGIKNEITIKCLEDVFYFPAEPITKSNPPIARPPGTVASLTSVDTYFTAQTIDPRNQGMVETVLWANKVATYCEEIFPGVWQATSTGPFAESGPSPRNTFFDGVSADAHNQTGTSWLIGKRFLMWDDTAMTDEVKAMCGVFIVDDVGGHWENYGTPEQTYVDTKFLIHRDPSYDGSNGFVKDMVFQVRGGDTYGMHYIQFQTANPVLGETPLVFADLGTSFAFADTTKLLRSDQMAGQALEPNSLLTLSQTSLGGDFTGFDMLPGTPGVRSIPAGTWKITPSLVSVSGGDEGAITNLGFKIWRSGTTSGLVFEVLSEPITPDMATVAPIFYPAPGVPLDPDSSDILVLIPTLHTTSTTPVTLNIGYNGIYAIQVQIPHSGDTGAMDAPDESFFSVTIDANGVIKDFGSHRNLLVSGAGPLKAIATTGCVGGTSVKLTFKDSTKVSPNQTVAGSAPILTSKNAAGTYEGFVAPANTVALAGLRNDAGTSAFWQLSDGGNR